MILVVAALVFTYVDNPLNQRISTTTTTTSLYFSGIILISGSESSNSLNTTCSGDSQLDIYVTNTSPNTISMTNVTIFASGLSKNATTLVSLPNGCLPISEDPPAIQSGTNDLLIATYPNIAVPYLSHWNVIINFSNGQNLTQTNLISQG